MAKVRHFVLIFKVSGNLLRDCYYLTRYFSNLLGHTVNVVDFDVNLVALGLPIFFYGINVLVVDCSSLPTRHGVNEL